MSPFEVLVTLFLGFELAPATFLWTLAHGFWEHVDQGVDELLIVLDFFLV